MSKETANCAPERAGLRSNCLSFTEVLGQSIANIAPSATPAFTIPAVFLLAGNGTWLAYVFATIAVLLVGLHIRYFSKRSASPGALYTFISDGAGPMAGFISGNGLVLAYLLTGAATLPCFASFTNVIMEYLGLPAIPTVVYCLVGIAAVWLIVYKDVQISAKLMLICEAVSLALIMVLGVIVFVHSNFTFYLDLFKLTDTSTSSIRMGLVLAFFSFVGFESATALGHEAKNPFKNIPKAVLISGGFVGVLFTAFSLIEIVGFLSAGADLANTVAPLSDLATQNGVGLLGVFISVGALISFWSCTVACVTAASRILHSMGNQKLVPSFLSKVHSTNDTPHIASSILSVVTFIIPAVMLLMGQEPMMIFTYLGTIATLGFLVSYILIVIAAPIFLYKRKELKVGHVILSILTLGILMIPMVGSVYPLPAFPFSLFPFLFLGWLIFSAIWYVFADKKRKNSSSDEVYYDAIVPAEKA